MPISERLMAPGSWTLNFRNLDRSVVDAFTPYGHVFVLPSPVDVRMLSDSIAQTLARYVGILQVVDQPDERSTTLSGCGIAGWLGFAPGYGDLIDNPIDHSAGSALTTWTTDLVGTLLSLTVGTTTTTGTNAAWVCPRFITVREALDYVCTLSGGEWKVQNDFTVDTGPASSLFRTTPNVVVLPKEGGRDLHIDGLQVDSLAVKWDATEYSTKMFVASSGDAPIAPIGDADVAPASSYKDGRGNTVRIERVIDAPTLDGATNADAYAATALAALSSLKRPLTLSTDTYDIGQLVVPGDYFYVHDPLRGLFDSANQIFYRGQIRRPIVLRCFAYDWPVEFGMSVFYRDLNGAFTDLTSALVAESGATTFEVGDPVRLTTDPKLATFSSAVARLGDAGDGTIPFVSPTLTATTTNPTLGTASVAEGYYKGEGDWIKGKAHIQFGTSGTNRGAGQYLVSLPVAMSTAITNPTIGGGFVYDADVGNFRTFVLVPWTTTTCYMVTSTTNAVTDTNPWTFASGATTADQISYWFDYRAA